VSDFNSAPLFFLDSPLIQDSRIEINGDEAGHILQSRRQVPGDEIALTDGNGVRATAVIRDVNKSQRALVADIIRVEEVSLPAIRRILATSIPKGDRQSELLSMSTQLGMDEYWPLRCDFSVVRYQDRMRQRWHRLIVSACKQSRQCNFPKIGAERSINDILSDESSQRLIVVGDIQGQSITSAKEQLTKNIQEIIMLIGPEGGFSALEQEVLDQETILKLRLSKQILRTETAAVSLLAVVNQLI